MLAGVAGTGARGNSRCSSSMNAQTSFGSSATSMRVDRTGVAAAAGASSGLEALLWRRGVGSGSDSCSGLGSGSGEDGGMRGRSRSCCSRSRSCAASRILSLVISSFDERSFACGGREEARGVI